MWISIKEGWTTAKNQPFLLLALFLYQFVWGFVLYRFIQSIVEPLLHRFPGGVLPGTSVQLFFAESEFQLFKTDLALPFLWSLLGMAALRMLLTPLLQAGIYFSLHHSSMNGGYRFLQGIKRLAKPFLVYYGIQTAVTLLPLYWILPLALERFRSAPRYEEAGMALLPLTAGMLIYGFLVHLIFVLIMLHRTTGERWADFWLPAVRSFGPAIGISAALLLLAGAATALVMTVSMVWAGLAALLLMSFYHFVRIWMKLWVTASQYRLWLAKM